MKKKFSPPATKADLRALHKELKAELRNCATKQDLERYATKEDLQDLEGKLERKIAGMFDERNIQLLDDIGVLFDEKFGPTITSQNDKINSCETRLDYIEVKLDIR